MKNTVVVSPDLGNAKEASHFARILGLPMAAGSKKRLSDDRVVIDTLVGDVEGKNVIVLDDEIANGGTIMEVLNRLRERRVKRIAVACTHGLFTGKAIARLGSQPDIAEIVTTDTVPVPPEKRLPNMKILSIAPLLAEAIRRIHVGESVSVLFDAVNGLGQGGCARMTPRAISLSRRLARRDSWRDARGAPGRSHAPLRR